MAQQVLNIGASANDQTGDTIRVGGDKINDNFTELYSTISTVSSTANSALQPTDFITSGSIIARASGNLNFSSGSPGYVWTIQGDGSVAFSDTAALPADGVVGQYIVNTGSGEGDWADLDGSAVATAISNLDNTSLDTLATDIFYDLGADDFPIMNATGDGFVGVPVEDITIVPDRFLRFDGTGLPVLSTYQQTLEVIAGASSIVSSTENGIISLTYVPGVAFRGYRVELEGDSTIAPVTGLEDGVVIPLRVVMDGTGGHTLGLESGVVFGGGYDGSLNDTADAETLLAIVGGVGDRTEIWLAEELA